MTTLSDALALASRGFHVFPCRPNSKLPAIEDFPNRATTNEKLIHEWFSNSRGYNIGISTSKFSDDKALCVVDVDTKERKHGDETLLELEMRGDYFPVTLEQSTPSGGRHLIYVADTALRQGVDTLGIGLDIRSRGGYILGPGSSIDGKAYTQINGHGTLAPTPDWLVRRLGVDRADHSARRDPLPGVDSARAAERAAAWLKDYAPLATEGVGGDLTTYKVAAGLKDYGCCREDALFLLDMYWNHRCSPPWSADELEEKVDHAYKYGREPQGSSAPEAVFPPEPPTTKTKGHPFEELNREYAFIKKGAFILQETTDAKGAFVTEHLSQAEFHGWFANVPFAAGNQRPRPISTHWVEWTGRRQYEGVVFMPCQDPGPRWYNLWRGFRVEPAAKGNHPSVELFLEHARKNVCGGDEGLFRWLIGYFAHMIQRPWEKPLVALVFRGKKGTGKNALVERVGHLLGGHFMVADDERYLLGNFNSHIESNLFFVLDEAAWAGDKKAEGKLKGLITGTQHNIERKGQEPYRVDNLTRVAIIGNEDWLVPATQDERRFAVFNIGEGRMQDRKFFIDMREGMEAGGYACLLKFLQDFDLTGIDVNDAPNTEALVQQKHASLDTVQQWWLDCISAGQISGGDWAGEWPDAISTNRLRDALARWARSRNIRSRLPEEIGFGRILANVAPSFRKKKTRAKAGETSYAFHSPGLEQLRKDWNHYIGWEVEWPSD